MDSYDSKRVLEEAMEKINTPKGWAIAAGVGIGFYLLNKNGIIKRI